MRTIVVMPQYNEERTIIGVLDRIQPHADLIIVVNDGSTDGSKGLLEEWAKGNPKLNLLNLGTNKGMSGAIHVGFHWVETLMTAGFIDPDDCIVTIDADGQHLPEEIPLVVSHLYSSGLDVVLTRRDFSGYPMYKRLGNRGLSLYASILSGFRYKDVECGFRAMRGRTIPMVLRYFTGMRYGVAQELGIITALLGMRIDNDFPCTIAYYRLGARFSDGFTNARMGLRAFIRVKAGKASDPAREAADLFADVEILGAPWASGPICLTGSKGA